MKLNYQPYANSTNARHNRRAAVIITWANKTIYLYHFTARKKKRFYSYRGFTAHLFVSRYSPIDVDFMRNPRGEIDTRRRKVETRDSHAKRTHAELASSTL